MRKNQKLFLSSSPEEFGTVCTCVETPQEKDINKKMTIYVDAEVRITDCQKPIYLDFNFSNKAQYHKRKEKVQNLIKALQRFEKEMEAGFRDFEMLKTYQSKMEEKD